MTITAIDPRYSNLHATHLGRGRYAVRPAGQLGTCGFYPAPWTVVYVTARSPIHARAKARGRVFD
jgi:hypothetical protein